MSDIYTTYKEVQTKMETLKQKAQTYESKAMKNIADLEKVPVELPLVTEDRQDNEGKPFTVSFITIDGDDYRVPASVLKALKEILAVKPTLKTFRVQKSGEGMKTSYTVIPLE